MLSPSYCGLPSPDLRQGLTRPEGPLGIGVSIVGHTLPVDWRTLVRVSFTRPGVLDPQPGPRHRLLKIRRQFYRGVGVRRTFLLHPDLTYPG